MCYNFHFFHRKQRFFDPILTYEFFLWTGKRLEVSRKHCSIAIWGEIGSKREAWWFNSISFARKAPSRFEEAMFRFIKLITVKNAPLSIVEDHEDHRFWSFNVSIDTKTVVYVVFNLVVLVERIASGEMKCAKDLFLFDRSSCSDLDYVYLLASYYTKQSSPENGLTISQDIPRMVILSLLPINSVSNTQQAEEDDESFIFDAKTHVQFFTESFRFHNLDF